MKQIIEHLEQKKADLLNEVEKINKQIQLEKCKHCTCKYDAEIEQIYEKLKNIWFL